MTSLPATNYRFGPFEVIPASGELLKDGRRLRLQDQPFRVLLVLLEHAGQVVTREEIQRRIWPDNTFVDFDSSMRVAVRKLRDALGDDPDRPVYIETIPKRGYRFLAAAMPVAIGEARAVDAEVTPTALVETNRPRVPRLAIAAAGAVVLIAVALGAYFRATRRSTAVLSDKDTVVLADFVNTTRDPVFDATLRQGLVVALEQSPFLSLVSEERIGQVLRLMAQPPDVPLTPTLARAVCERTGSAAVLSGSIARLGNAYVVGLRAERCRTGETLDEEQAQAPRKEDVLNALDRIAGTFRARLGESLATVKQYDTPLADATTSSLDALRAYSAGLRVLYSAGSSAALPLFKQATDLDPNFAMAHAFLGRMYGDVGELAASAASTARAYQLRDRTSQAEKYFISASYDLQVSGNLEKAQQTCRAWIEEYPRAIVPHAFLGGIIDLVAGRFDRAAAEAARTVELDPDFWVGYSLQAYADQYLNRFTDAEHMLDRAAARQLENAEFAVQRYDLAFLKNDPAAMDHTLSLARGGAEAAYAVDHHAAFVLAYHGRLQEASATVRRAAAMALQAGERERAAQFEAGSALWSGLFGLATPARRGATTAVSLSDARDVEYGAAVALALARDAAQAQVLATDLERRFDEDTSVRFSYLPTIRALLAVNDGEPARALELLRMAAPDELGMPRSGLHAAFGALYPVYVRGLALLADHRGANAAAEFQKILDRPGVVVSDPIGALAQYHAGRALAMAGDVSAATSAYEAFLRLWKDADPDIPILKQAKSEYAALRRKLGVVATAKTHRP